MGKALGLISRNTNKFLSETDMRRDSENIKDDTGDV